MYSCYPATRTKLHFLMDVQTILGWSTHNYSKNQQDYINFHHLKIIYVFKNMKSFSKLFSCAPEMQLVKHLKCYSQLVCVWHAFKGHLLADHVPLLAGWGVSRHRQSLPGLLHTETHIVSSHFWGQQKLDSPEIPCFTSALQEGGALLASEILATISGQFGSKNSCLWGEAHPVLFILNIWR